MDCQRYFEDIKKLREADSELVEVAHDPMSERYIRAQTYLGYLIDESECIGCYERNLESGDKIVEVVTWLDPIRDRFCNDEFGSYAVYKTMYEDFEPQFSELFAYYDGRPTAADKKNKAFNDIDEAITEMESYGKYKLCM